MSTDENNAYLAMGSWPFDVAYRVSTTAQGQDRALRHPCTCPRIPWTPHHHRFDLTARATR